MRSLALLLLLVACTHRVPAARPPTGDDIALQQAIQALNEHRCPDVGGIVAPSLERIPHNTPEKVYRATRIPGMSGVLMVTMQAAIAPNPVETLVVSTAWSDLLYVKAYCDAEQGRLEDAAASLTWALEYMPDDLVLSSELGFTLASLKDFEGALARFDAAYANVVYLEGSPGLDKKGDKAPRIWGDTLVGWKGRALRGRGFVLVELARLDEAEKTYREALALDPSDAQSQKELQLIEGLKKR